jgi:hypothetical protein
MIVSAVLNSEQGRRCRDGVDEGLRLVGAAGLSRSTVISGASKIESRAGPSRRSRAPGVGREKAIDDDANLLLEPGDSVSPDARDHPVSPLRWTLKATHALAEALLAKGFQMVQF